MKKPLWIGFAYVTVAALWLHGLGPLTSELFRRLGVFHPDLLAGLVAWGLVAVSATWIIWMATRVNRTHLKEPGDREAEDSPGTPKEESTASGSKSTNPRAYWLLTPQVDPASTERFQLERDLRRAVEDHAFAVHFEPRVDLRTGSVGSFEALARWKHPRRGVIPPAVFIPIAEESGLIRPLGVEILRLACDQARIWNLAGYRNLRVAVNLSARQLQQPDLVDRVVDILREMDLSARLLELEITESTALSGDRSDVLRLQTLHRMGLRIAIDDFGTGHSSLSHLKELPIDSLKIDQSFVRGLGLRVGASADDAAIIRAIIALGKSLRLKVIAEGVENEKQRAILKSLGCDEAQGHLLCRPMAADQITVWIKSGRLRLN